MRRIKIKRTDTDHNTRKPEGQWPFETVKDPRERIKLALGELYQLNTRSDIEQAFENGLPFSHEGFTKRIHVGTDTLRVTNSDLFDKLEERLRFLERVAGRPLRGQAAKRRPKSHKSERKNMKKGGEAMADTDLHKLRDEIRLLKQLLENAQEEILDLTHRLSMALQLPPK